MLLATGQTIAAFDGGELTVAPHSICVHGDTPGAVEIARAVRTALEAAGVRIKPFVGS